jgi:hypothetical protein
VITTGGTTGSVKACSITVTGKNAAEETITEAFAFTEDQNGATVGTKAFLRVDSVTIPAQDGAGATFDFGSGNKLGLGRCFGGYPFCVGARVGATQESTLPTLVFDADEVEKNTADFHTDPNGTNNHELWLV